MMMMVPEKVYKLVNEVRMEGGRGRMGRGGRMGLKGGRRWVEDLFCPFSGSLILLLFFIVTRNHQGSQ